MVAVIIVVVVGSMNDWQKERQFKKLNEKKEDRTVKVIRSGAEKVVNIKVSFNCFFLAFPYSRDLISHYYYEFFRTSLSAT